MSSNILEQYQIVKSIQGGYLIEHKKTKEKAIYKNIISHIHYDDQKQLIERRTSIQNCPQLQKIIHCQMSQYKFENNNQFLSNISIIYEDIVLRFDAEINNRIKQKIYWTEEEILNTLESAVQALCILHEHHLVHGDIRPSSIACDLSGEVKLLDQFATSNHYFKNLSQIIQSGGYLSPELCKSIQNDNQEYVLESRNDIFSLGLVFLEATTLLSSFDITQNYQVNEELLNNRLELVSKLGYSPRLLLILQNMLQINGDFRPSIQYILQIGWQNPEVSKSMQFQEISTIPIAENESMSHSIILKRVLGDQSTQNSDGSKRTDNPCYSLLLKDQQLSQNTSMPLFNDSQSKMNKILDSQDTSLNTHTIPYQPQNHCQNQAINKSMKPSEEYKLTEAKSQQNFYLNKERPSQQENHIYQPTKYQHNRCKTECEEIKVFTKNSQKSFSRIGEESEEYDQSKESQFMKQPRKREQEKSMNLSQKKYTDLSTNEQYENCCPQCVKKMVSPLLRNAFSPRLEAIQDEESIRKSQIKQTPLIRISKVKRELEIFEPINFKNFQINQNPINNNSNNFNHMSSNNMNNNRVMQSLDQFYNTQTLSNNNDFKNIKPPLNNQSINNQLNRHQFQSQKSQQSFHQSSINSNWNQSAAHFNSNSHQQSQNDSFNKGSSCSQANNPLKNIQNNQFLNRSYSNLKSISQFRDSQNNQQQEFPQNVRRNPAGHQKVFPNSQLLGNKTSQASSITQVQRKPLFGNTQNYVSQNFSYQHNLNNQAQQQ